MEGVREEALVKAKAGIRAPGSQPGSCINECERETETETDMGERETDGDRERNRERQ